MRQDGGGEKYRKKRGLIHVQWPGKYYRLTQTTKNREDWWHKDNSATADLFSRQMNDVMKGRRSLITRPIFIPAAIHGSMKVTQSSRLSKNKGKWHYHSIPGKAGGRAPG